MFAIIPSKLNSRGCPGKNGRHLGGVSLIEQAVSYARQEGVHPIVATPDGAVAALAHRYEVAVYYEPERGGDGDALGLIRGVMKQLPQCRYFALLQPTSPFREPGKLAKIWRDLRGAEGARGYYTARRLKLQGRVTNGEETHTINSPRRQVNPNWVWAADGNIFAWNREAVAEEGAELLSEAWEPVWDGHELTHLDIDAEGDYALAAELAGTGVGEALLPARVGRRIALVSNNMLWGREYNEEIDHDYDLVVRVNDLRSLDTGCVGRRTDIAYVLPGTQYLANDAGAQHGDALRGCRRVVFARQVVNGEESMGRMLEVVKRHGLGDNWSVIEDGTIPVVNSKTTLYEAAWHLTREYPGCELTIYGDRHAGTRALEHAGNLGQPEDYVMEELTRKYKIRWVEPMEQ